jgi:hypothetical protein
LNEEIARRRSRTIRRFLGHLKSEGKNRLKCPLLEG